MTTEFVKVDLYDDASENEDGHPMYASSPFRVASKEDEHDEPSETKTSEAHFTDYTCNTECDTDSIAESLAAITVGPNDEGNAVADRPDGPVLGRPANGGDCDFVSTARENMPAEIGLEDYQLTFFQDLCNDNDDLCPPALIPRGFLESCIRGMVKDILAEKEQGTLPSTSGKPHKSRRRRNRRNR